MSARKRKSSPTTQRKSNQLRIIGGQWRGRKLCFAEADGLRPTTNRIRETLFNWLMDVTPGCLCLDLFSGSGALGLEALSRGATAATFIEYNVDAATHITNNIKLLKCDQAQVVQGDCLDYLRSGPAKPYDLVFLDPPFNLNLWRTVIELLEKRQWLSENATIYIESPSNCAISPPDNWELHRRKQAGDVLYSLYQKVPLPPSD